VTASKITTSLAVDDALDMGAGYSLNAQDRRYIDNQIRGCQAHLVNHLLSGVAHSGNQQVRGVAVTPGWEVVGVFIFHHITPVKLRAFLLVSRSALTARARIFGPIGIADITPAEIATSVISTQETIETLCESADCSGSLRKDRIYQVQLECTGGATAIDFAAARWIGVVAA